MRPDHPITPFDVELEDERDLTQQFWGTSRAWRTGPTPSPDRRNPTIDDTPVTGSLRAVRNGFAAFRPQRRERSTGEVRRTRRHGLSSTTAPDRSREATIGELAEGWTNDDTTLIDQLGPDGARSVRRERSADGRPPTAPTTEEPTIEHELPLDHTPAARLGVGAVDPLLLRVGLMGLLVVMLVPFALALRPSGVDSAPNGVVELPVGTASDTAIAPAPAADAPAVDAPAAQPSAAPGEGAPSADPPAAQPAAATPTAPTAPEASDQPSAATAGEPAQPSSETGDVAESGSTTAATSGAIGSEAATVGATAERLVLECSLAYVAGPGDSWYRIAEAAGVTPSALVDENLATLEAPIFPGDEICLPAGATVPVTPTTAPATTTPATTGPATTAPATTAPATTLPSSSSATPSEVEQIIRDVWPDELEEKALEVAWRESRYVPTAYNGWCCYGVFQIYWSVHRSWLDDYGIHEVEDLYDPRKNTEAAYALYRAAGGWGPWGG